MALRLILLLVTCRAVQGEIPFQVLHKLLEVKNPADLFQLFNVSTDSFGPDVSGPADFIPDSVPRGDSFPTSAREDRRIRGRLGGLGGNDGQDQGVVLEDGNDDVYISIAGRIPHLPEKVIVSRQGADVVTSLLSEIDFCTPRGTEVKVPNDSPSTIVVPSCVNLQRCGGCCHANIFQCEPLETKNTTITVMKLELSGDDLVLKAIEGIEMEEHVSCQCGCKVKPHHCNRAIHKYEDCACTCLQPRQDCEEGKVWDEKECQCVCQSGEINCRKRYHWNPDLCECLCAPRVCPMGRTLDFNTCKCKKNATRRRDNSGTPCKRRCPPGARLNRRNCTCSQGQVQRRVVSPFLPFEGLGSGEN